MEPLRNVAPGDPLAISAATYNDLIATVRDRRGRLGSVESSPRRWSYDAAIVPMRNDSGAPRGRGDVLGVSAPLVLPATDLREFLARPALRGVLPAESHVGRFAVLLDPVSPGRVARACVAGVCLTRVQMVAPDHRYAEIAPGQTTWLRSGSTGSVALLWTAGVTGTVWAVVRLQGGAGPGVTIYRMEIVQLLARPDSGRVWTFRARRVGTVEEPVTVSVYVDCVRPNTTWEDLTPPMMVGMEVLCAPTEPDGALYCLDRLVATTLCQL